MMPHKEVLILTALEPRRQGSGIDAMSEQSKAASHRVARITDSTCDIPADLLDRYDISFVPCFILWGEEAYRDRLDLAPVEFYRRLQTDPRYPSTSNPTPAHFVEAYRASLDAGAAEIVVVTVSSAMSGTFQCATQAAGMVDARVHVVDSRGPTMSLGWQVLAAARAREAGADAAGMVAAANKARASMVQLVALDTLEYLHKGGRIGNATRLVGSLLNVKPMVYIDHVSGLVEQAGRSRTRRHSIETLYAEFFRRLGPRRPVRVAVLHGNVPDDARALAGRIQREQAPAELLMNITGPVLGVHTGPGALALCGYVDD